MKILKIILLIFLNLKTTGISGGYSKHFKKFEMNFFAGVQVFTLIVKQFLKLVFGQFFSYFGLRFGYYFYSKFAYEKCLVGLNGFIIIKVLGFDFRISFGIMYRIANVVEEEDEKREAAEKVLATLGMEKQASLLKKKPSLFENFEFSGGLSVLWKESGNELSLGLGK